MCNGNVALCKRCIYKYYFFFLIIFGLVCQNWRKYLNIVRSASKWSYWIFHNMRFLFDLFHNMLNYAVNE